MLEVLGLNDHRLEMETLDKVTIFSECCFQREYGTM
jgi:hypothetical protein